MQAQNILLLSDNEYLLSEFRKLDAQGLFAPHIITYGYSYYNAGLANRQTELGLVPVNVKKDYGQILESYDLLVSLHCKQLFPQKLVEGMRCINIHPGLNPHNRGWFPQVFSIINGKPAGATIHEIDAELDHGAIIAQQEVQLYTWDTSLSAYNRILQAELELIKQHFKNIIEGEYTVMVAEEGNLNLKKDFDALCNLDISQHGTLEEHINLLRALTHGTYKNAYFIDKDGNKVYVNIVLEPAE